jgi:hypothetical protein
MSTICAVVFGVLVETVKEGIGNRDWWRLFLLSGEEGRRNNEVMRLLLLFLT